MTDAATITEAEILADAIAPDRADMPVEAAHAVLDWKFSDHATQHMRALLDRNNKGVLTPAEEVELDRYRRVGMLLDLVQAKARVSLRRAETAS
ncbi:MAG: hypothetical protein SH850_30450 [Planctomycetaceae bacterium]|nr:hypothetical protein [Planctomycetaceae bacterium]